MRADLGQSDEGVVLPTSFAVEGMDAQAGLLPPQTMQMVLVPVPLGMINSHGLGALMMHQSQKMESNAFVPIDPQAFAGMRAVEWHPAPPEMQASWGLQRAPDCWGQADPEGFAPAMLSDGAAMTQPVMPSNFTSPAPTTYEQIGDGGASAPFAWNPACESFVPAGTELNQHCGGDVMGVTTSASTTGFEVPTSPGPYSSVCSDVGTGEDSQNSIVWPRAGSSACSDAGTQEESQHSLCWGRPFEEEAAARQQTQGYAEACQWQPQSSIRMMAFDRLGCREVQDALQNADMTTAIAMASELEGCVLQGVRSPFCNYVLQKIIVLLPSDACQFIAWELRGSGATVARHRYGCRILCRLVEHQPTVECQDTASAMVLDEVIAAAGELTKNEMARHVLRSILEHGWASQRTRVVGALLEDVMRNAVHRNSSYVLQHALEHASAADRNVLLQRLLAQPRWASRLAASQPGYHVLQTILARSQEETQRRQVLDGLVEDMEDLSKSQGGRALLSQVAGACA